MNDSLLKKVRTPAYLFSIDELLARLSMIRTSLGPSVRIVFAVKANPFLIRPLLSAVDGFEVCSPGEVRLCLKAGVPPEKLVLSGVNKEAAVYTDFVRILLDAPVYTVESEQQMHLLNEAAARFGTRLRVLLRRSGGNQFGMDDETLCHLLGMRERFPGLCITGFQQYTGTQKRPGQILREIDRFDTFLCRIGAHEAHPETDTPDAFLSEAEFGPGLPVSYFVQEDEVPDEEVLGQLAGHIANMHFPWKLTLEIGRFLCAFCGYYLTTAADIKNSDGASYVITDGGIHQMNYYHQFMGMKLPHMRLLRSGSAASAHPGRQNASGSTCGCKEAEDELRHYTVCGSLCTASDILVRDFPTPALETGDVLVFERVGAYSVTEGISLFLSRDLPGVYLSEGDRIMRVREITRTENLNDSVEEDMNYGRTD